MHQLCQREPATVLRTTRLQAGAAGVQPGGHQLAAHRVHRQPGRPGHDRQQTHEHHLPHRRGEQVPQGTGVKGSRPPPGPSRKGPWFDYRLSTVCL